MEFVKGLNSVSGRQYETPSMDRRWGPSISTPRKMRKFKMKEVDYSPLIDRRTVLHVQMGPKKINFYTNKGKSMSFTLTYQLIDEDTDTDKDPTYVPSGLNPIQKGTSNPDPGMPQLQGRPTLLGPRRLQFQAPTQREPLDLGMNTTKTRLMRPLVKSQHLHPKRMTLLWWLMNQTGLGIYSEEIMQEFYASYDATLRGSIDRWARPAKQAPLTYRLVKGCQIDISQATIRQFLYGPSTGSKLTRNTSEFAYRWEIVQGGAFQRSVEQREAVKNGCPNCQFETVIDRQLAGTMDIGLFKDEGNVAAAHRGPRIEVPSLKEYLADTVELAQVANLAAPNQLIKIYTTMCDVGPSSSSSEVRATVGHSTPPHSTLDAEIHLRPSPTTDLTVIYTELAILQADVDTILEMWGTKPESAPTELAEDTVLDALNRYIHTTEAGDESRVRKREKTELERYRRAFFVDEEICQRRALEMDVGASISIPVSGESST
ncbi:hypothetical protein EJD97_021341 [Solanum chilense]|uniref:Uncharacterized protein n=1 Tax=Solanum chilense TaxID=4083 RepID=A0A6N2CA79_SOLCI|nr:hypothetical protein EJD97_021341 [Solanum chilense]